MWILSLWRYFLLLSFAASFFYVSLSPTILIGQLNLKIDTYGVWMVLLALLSICISLLISRLRKVISDDALLKYSFIVIFVTGFGNAFLWTNEALEKYLFIYSIISLTHAIVFSVSLAYSLEPFSNKSGEVAGVPHTVQLTFSGFCIFLSSWLGVYAEKFLVYFLTAGGLMSFMIIQYRQCIIKKER